MDEPTLHALRISLFVATLATIFATIVGVPLAFAVARRRFFGRSLLDTLLMLPLVLPPTVVGYLLIVLFGRHGWVGSMLDRVFDYSILFRIEGAIVAASIVALPLVYLPARSAFASIEPELEDIARLLGANRRQTFWHVALPIARRGIAGGVILGFARALGEFGATMMILGFQPGRTTLPILVYARFEQGRPEDAWPAVLLLIACSLAVIVLHNRSPLSKRD